MKLDKKIAIFYGTRPEFLKIKPILNFLDKSSYKLFYVKQHKDILENTNFDKIIDVKNHNRNRLNLIINSILKNSEIFIDYKYVLVQGDTQTAMSVALASFFNKQKIIHLEAGLRSNNLYSPFPEEANRKIISSLANFHFCPTGLSKQNLIRENIKKNIFITGNTSLDNLLIYKKKINYENQVVITLHRRENYELYDLWLDNLNRISKDYPFIKFFFILHPNPVYKKKIKNFRNIFFLEHMNHSQLMNYICKAKLIITDSGGLQEEGSFLEKKVIVCRKETERPEGINTNHLYLCPSPRKLRSIFSSLIFNYKIKKKSPYGDGRSGMKISKLLLKICK